MNENKETNVYKYEQKMTFDKSNVFWGIFFIVAAVFILIGRLDIFSDFSIFKLLITLLLGAWLLQSIVKKEFGGILFSIAFLCILYDEFLGIEELTPWPVLGAAAFASIGLSFLFKKKPIPNQTYTYRKPIYADGANDINHGMFTFSNSFGESVKYVNSDDFIQADINNSFGSTKIYFDDAMIQNGQANINLNVKFGSVELFFPKTWNIVNHASAALGSIEENNRSCSNGSPTVVLNGEVAFGSIIITYI